MEQIPDRELTSAPATTPPARPRSSCLPWVLLAVVLVPLLVLVIGALVTFGGVAATWNVVNNALAGRLVLRTEQPSVVTEMRKLNRLETSGFTVEKVIEGGEDHGNPVLNALLGDRLLFIAHGEVIAGIDLSRLGEDDVTVSSDGRSVAIRLPAAEILSHRLDNEQSRVYDRQTGVLARGDPGLETRVRQEAERQILQAACDGGILMQANTNAQNQLRALLTGLHFSQVEFLPSPPGDTTGCEGV